MTNDELNAMTDAELEALAASQEATMAAMNFHPSMKERG